MVFHAPDTPESLGAWTCLIECLILSAWVLGTVCLSARPSLLGRIALSVWALSPICLGAWWYQLGCRDLPARTLSWTCLGTWLCQLGGRSGKTRAIWVPAFAAPSLAHAAKATVPGWAVGIGFAGRAGPWLKASRLYSGPLFKLDAIADKYDEYSQ